MTWYWILLIIYAAVTALLMIVGVGNNELDSIENFINPINVYRLNKVNVFGCILLTILGNIMFPYYAIWYWFCKLCAVGRKR